jgi:hypothetical protein
VRAREARKIKGATKKLRSFRARAEKLQAIASRELREARRERGRKQKELGR